MRTTAVKTQASTDILFNNLPNGLVIQVRHSFIQSLPASLTSNRLVVVHRGNGRYDAHSGSRHSRNRC